MEVNSGLKFSNYWFIKYYFNKWIPISLLIISIWSISTAAETVTATIRVKPYEIINENFQGFGVEADPFLWMKENREKDIRAKDIALCINRTRDMRLDIVRVFAVIEWWQPERNVFTWHSDGMISLCKSLDVYESSGTDVIITIWGRIPEWLEPEGNVPTDMDSFTSSIVKFMEYLIIYKKYGCIRYLIIYNEPDKEFQRPFSEYLSMYRQVAEKLKDLKIRDKLKLIGPDEAVDEDWFRMATLNEDVFDVFDSHTYAFQSGSDAGAWMDVRLGYIDRNTKKTKQWFITEFGIQSPGMDAFQNPALDTTASAIFAADFAITAVNRGASAVLIWCLHDICYPTENNQIMKWGLWKYVNEMWEPRPTYYVWRLITRYTEKDAKIIRTESSNPDIGVALLQMKGKYYTYLVLNRSKETMRVKIMSPGGNLAFTKYEHVEGKVESGYCIKMRRDDQGKVHQEFFEDTMMRNSFAVYTSLNGAL